MTAPRRCSGVASALALTFALAASARGAEPLAVPLQSAFGMIGNGGITAIVPHGNVTYIGGNFDELAAITGALSRLDASTGRRIAPLVEVQHGEVRAIAPDRHGGFYVGGTFSDVGGQARARLAHIQADGSLDPAFNPGVSGDSSAAVNALAVSDDGALVYVGGGFSFIGGQARSNLAALDAATGAVTSFNPAGLGTDGAVFALEFAGSHVYVGGQFTKLGGQTRNGLAKVQASTGGDLGWIPNPTFNAGGGLIFAIDAVGSSVYVGGVFTAIGGQPRTHLARLSATTGEAMAGFAPNPDDAVFTLLVSGGAVLAGGDFNTIAGQSRPALARLDGTTGALTAFNAFLPASDGVRALALTADSLFIGGYISTVGGQARLALASVDSTTGSLRSFNANVGGYEAATAIKALGVDGTKLYVGGNHFFVNRVTRHGIAALDADGVPTPFNPDAGIAGPGVFNDVSAIAVFGNAIYLGGNFITMGGQPRNRLAKVSLEGTLDPTFNPNPTGGSIPGVDVIVVTSTDVFVGGDFSSIGGQPRIDLARLNPTTGLVDGGRQSFDPDPLNGINPSRVRTLQVSGDAVYAGGDFTTIGGQARNKIAKISAATGDADVLFNANVSGGSNVGPYVFDIVLARSTLYVAGDFSSIGGAARNNVATLNPPTGAEVTGFNPNVTGGTRPQVFKVVVTNDEVFIGGSFLVVQGQAQGQIARLTHAGNLAPFNPKVRDAPGAVLALASSGSTLYAGGLFFEMAGRPRLAYAQFTGGTEADGDADGLPDAWELQYGLQSDSSGASQGAADPDKDGKSNLQELRDGTHPRGFYTRYFAEGATGGFFKTRMALLNVNPTASVVLLRFQKGDGTTSSEFVTIDGSSRKTIDVAAVSGMGTAEFSTVVESDEGVVVDRTMTWDGSGYGSHAETSLAAPSTIWYLAEGSTKAGFDLFYLIQNPNNTEATVTVRYLLPAGEPVTKNYTVGPMRRFNIWVDADDPRLADTDVSAVITCTQPVIVERAMYLNAGGRLFGAGHESAGITAPSTEWFLAEGATGAYFDLFVLIANPSLADAQIQATYLLPDGTPLVKNYRVAANSRFNIWVDTEDARLADTAVSTVITSTNGVPVIVERAMWWPGPSAATWAEAHNAAGLTTTGRKWALAEGEVGGNDNTETFILIANRGGAVSATVTLLYEDGAAESKVVPLAASSRTNIAVAHDFPNSAGRRFGAIVEAASGGAQIVVERAMYSDAGGVAWAAGTNAVGTRLE